MDVVYFDQCLGGTHSKCNKFAPKVVKGYKQLQFLLMGTHKILYLILFIWDPSLRLLRQDQKLTIDITNTIPAQSI